MGQDKIMPHKRRELIDKFVCLFVCLFSFFASAIKTQNF